MATMLDERPLAEPTSAPEKPDSPGYRWYVLMVLLGIYLAGSLDRSMISVVMEPVKAEFQLSDSQLGLLSGAAFSVPFGLAALPLGWALDRFERRLLLGLLAGVWSLLTGLAFFAQSFTQLVVTRTIVGAADAGQGPASLSLLADTFPPNRRATAIGVYSIGTALSVVTIFLMGGALLKAFGWRSVFLVAGLPGLVLAMLVLFTFREPRRGRFDMLPGAPAPKTDYRASMLAMLLNRALAHAVIGYTLATGVEVTVLFWMSSFLKRVHHMQPGDAALWIGVLFGITHAVGALLIGPVADRYSRGEGSRLARIPAIGTAAGFLAGMVMVNMPSLDGALAGMTVLGFCAGVFTGPSYALIVNLAPPEARGSALSIAKLLSLLIGQSVIGYLTGALSDLIGGANSIATALMVTLVGHLWAALHFALAGRAAARQARTHILEMAVQA